MELIALTAITLIFAIWCAANDIQLGIGYAPVPIEHPG